MYVMYAYIDAIIYYVCLYRDTSGAPGVRHGEAKPVIKRNKRSVYMHRIVLLKLFAVKQPV